MAADADDPAVSWVGYLGYACRTDLPGRPASGVPDAVWMRVRDPWVIDEPAPGAAGEGRPVPPGGRVPPVPTEYAAAYDQVQRQLRAGNSYEVNLTYRDSMLSDRDPVATYLRLRELNPAPYSGYLQHRGVHLLSSSPERYATINRHRVVEAKPIKGTTPQGVRPGRGRAAPAAAGRGPEVPRREPDDRRPAAQRPVDGVRAGQRGGAPADAGGVLPHRAPAGLDDPRPAERRGLDRRRAARALPGGVDDRSAQAPHDGDHRRRRGVAARGATPEPSGGSPATVAPT